MIRLIVIAFFFICGSHFCYAQRSGSDSAKYSPHFKKMIERYSDNDSITISVTATNEAFIGLPIRIVNEYKSGEAYVLKIKKKDLPLLAQKGVLFIDGYIKPREELTTGSLDIATNKGNYAHHNYPEINGVGITASIKENAFDTADIDYRHRILKTNLFSPAVSGHASIMATTLAGAGNSSPYAMGIAYGSVITSSDFANLLPDADAVFIQNNISIQNHSYGTAIQNYYGAEARAFDQQAVNLPFLLHVFSGGNSGNLGATSGIYAGINGFANQTGNFKMAKNIMAVGAIDSFYNVSPLSSKGPAYDGRIRPELVAFGEDGSSGAAAMTSGAAALVQQAYKEQNGSIPSSALVKAVLLNSADDVNASHVDFASGFGSLNVDAAVKTITQQNFLIDQVSSGQVKSFPITLSANISDLKATIVWIDPPATVNATKALVNDIDFTVTSPLGENFLPWVLNTKPHADSLKLPATRGVDTVNNVEQVTIENPVAGIYQFQVRGSRMSGTQAFAIAFQMDTVNHFEWTFPTAIDQVEAGVSNVLRWQTNRSGSAILEYADDNNWALIATITDVQKGFYKWISPTGFTTANLRMRFLNETIVSDTFVISKAPGVNVGFDCPDSFLLYWNRLPVSAYEVYKLEDKYLQSFRTTADTFLVLDKAQNPAIYYSVAPVVNGRSGLRSFTVNYTAQGVGCYFKSFYLQLQTNTEASFVATLGSVYGVRSISFQKLQQGQFVTIKTISNPSVTDFNFTDSVLIRGVNTYRVQLTLATGQMIYSNLVTIYHFPDADVLIYPNPVRQSQSFSIATNKAGRIEVEFYNSTGALLRRMSLTELEQQVSANQFSKGIYFLRMKDDEGNMSVQKLVVY